MKINPHIRVLAVSILVSLGLFMGLRVGLIFPRDYIDILVMGIDSPEGFDARSDSINLVRIDYSRNRIGILAIPRDLMVDIPGHGRDKINHAHVYGGPELSCETVSALLNVPVKKYIQLNFPMFVKLIDELGGVTLDVEKPLHYDDYASGLHVHLRPGPQRLSGYQAMGYVRFRHDRSSDWGRIDRQHRFFKAVAQQLGSPRNFVRFPHMLMETASGIGTNLDVSEMIKISMRVPSIYKTGEVRSGYIPGRDITLAGIYYTVPDEKGLAEAVNKVIFGR